MHNNVGGSSLLSSDGYDLLRMKSGGHHHEKDMAAKMDGETFTGNVSFYSAKAEFYVASVDKDGGYKILAQALSVEFSSATGEADSASLQFSSSSISSFRVPSPLDVANKVLGFVENRLNAELEAGAGSERISSLISQAREGVQKGFAQARDDIESLGLMTRKLDKDIGKGFERINSGLTDMGGRFDGVQQSEGEEGVVGQPVPQSVELPVSQPAPQSIPQSVELPVSQPAPQSIPQSIEQPNVLTAGVDVSGAQAYEKVTTNSGGVEEVSSIYGRSTYKNSSEFSLKTQDGDTITIRYVGVGEEVFESSGDKFLLGQGQFQGYQLEVDGELDEGELAAIADLFSQLGEVSSLFFGGSFQEAFATAIDVGFDASEIASFSLDLFRVQTEEVRAVRDLSNTGDVYEQGGGSSVATQKNKPLIEMAGLFEKSLELLKAFDDQQFDFRKLVLESISIEAVEKGIESKVSQNDFSDFAEKLLKQLTE